MVIPAGICVLALAGVVQQDIGVREAQEAITLARSRDATLDRFHRGYIIDVGGPDLERVEVVTEFRRAVLLAEQRARMGDFTWGPAQVLDALRPYRGLVTIVAQIRLPPMNMLASVPAYEVTLFRPGARTAPARPRAVRRTPVLPAGIAPPGTPMIGATVETDFDLRELGPDSAWIASVSSDKGELGSVRIALADYR
jgi:hypothetical protein